MGEGKTFVTDEESNVVWRSWKSIGQAEALDRFARQSSPPIHMTAQFAGIRSPGVEFTSTFSLVAGGESRIS